MLILQNAHILTFDPAQPLAEALVIEGGKILFCGSNQGAQAYQIAGCQTENMGGRVLMPGMIDSHVHFDTYAASLGQVCCETETRAACLQRVREKVARLQPGEWVLGTGWSQDAWPEGPGNARLLDEAAPQNPVCLHSKSLHAAWVNSLALQKLHVDCHIQDPAGGHFGRNADGSPDGILYENAVQMLEAVLPQRSLAESIKNMQSAQKELWKLGLTGIHDFDGRHCFQALQELQAQGALKIRVIKAIRREQLAPMTEAGFQAGFGNDVLRVGFVKLFADGALGQHTAAMLQPYEMEPENRGVLLLDAESLLNIGVEAARARLPLAVHAIGDRANQTVLDGFERLRQYEREHDLPPLRHRVEHAQLLAREDCRRLADLQLTASVQPVQIVSDYLAADRFWGSRAKGAYVFNTLLGAGTKLAFGSDAPVENPDPFLGIHAAVTRRSAEGLPSSDGWFSEEKIGLDSALRAFTQGAAYAGGMETKLGMLKTGYLADCIIIEKNPFEIDIDEVRALQPFATMVNGEWVWRRDH